MNIWLPICFLAAVVLPFVVFHRTYQELLGLKSEIADLQRRRIRIDPDPVYVGNTLGWAIRVNNDSERAAIVAAEIVAADPRFPSPYLMLPVRLRATNHEEGDEVDAGPHSGRLFDLCMIWPDKVIILATLGQYSGDARTMRSPTGSICADRPCVPERWSG